MPTQSMAHVEASNNNINPVMCDRPSTNSSGVICEQLRSFFHRDNGNEVSGYGNITSVLDSGFEEVFCAVKVFISIVTHSCMWYRYGI